MSGHSKWANIKVRKTAQDKRRGQIFTKLVRAIAIAAREGPDPETNNKLKMAVERARAFNVPKDNIERAIKREGSENIEEFSLDAIGPGGVSLIIEGATDNKNRTLSEIKHIVEKAGGKVVQDGAVKWNFKRKGLLNVEKPNDQEGAEEFMLKLISAGAQDILTTDKEYELITEPEELNYVSKSLRENNIAVEDAMLGWTATQKVELSENDKKELKNLVKSLDEHQDVQNLWSNEL